MPGETRRTVLTAGAANLLVGIVKLAAGILTGSSAMLAEAAHSAADTLNQAFLLRSLRQSARSADPVHPFGYGLERYFWSLLAAFGIFIAGAGFSVFEGILALSRSGEHSATAAYVVLGISFIAEGTSFRRAIRQTRAEARARRVSFRQHLRESADTTVKTAVFEDSAAMIGLALAAIGIGMRQLTGSPAWDGGASIAIGVVLVAVAFKLGSDSKEFLIGRAASPEIQDIIRREIEATPGVTALLELRTMQLGPDHLLVAARVAFSDDISADRAEDVAGDIDRRLNEALPQVVHVFIDPTQHKSPTAAGPRGATA